ncbi:Transmembrane protein 68 [Holothuria leucospilota]|uniref:Transmembrane protein 68 n=1 Tax=Holothuria leucospilota TaxID=206669 RepID=A0A9Q1BUW0_HOLLE|nr:Transmembrane protein 68 [Holothuria leucospilota]
MNFTVYLAYVHWIIDSLENNFQPYFNDVWEIVAPYLTAIYDQIVIFLLYLGLDLPSFIAQFDLDVLAWCFWLFIPVAIVFLLPLLILFLLYGTILFLYFYKARHSLKDAYTRSLWDGARLTVATFWEGQGKIWHGYEIHGLENFPEEGPAVFCYYHGAIPVDLYYMMASIFIKKGRAMVIIGDKFIFSIPGFKLFLQVFDVTSGTLEECTKFLKEGQVIAVAPGGVREAFFSDSCYRLIWGKRVGFAKCALEAKAPIIPVYTQNCREGFRSLGIGKKYLMWLYEKTRLPVVPIYGGFPVKWRTFIGKPIPYQDGLSAEEFAMQAKEGIENLIKEHQRLPGNVLQALLDRFS